MSASQAGNASRCGTRWRAPSLTASLDPHGEEARLRRLRTMRSLSSLRERNCARRRARVRATRWHRRENHEASVLVSRPRPSRRLLAQAPLDEGVKLRLTQ